MDTPLRHQRGSAMVIALSLTMVLMGLVIAYSETILIDSNNTDVEMDAINAESIAQAGLNFALAELSSRPDENATYGMLLPMAGVPSTGRSPGFLGTKANPIRFGGGQFYTFLTVSTATVAKLNEDGTTSNVNVEFKTLTCIASAGGNLASTSNTYTGNGATHKLVAYSQNDQGGGPFWYAIYAGNRSGSNTLNLSFTGPATNNKNDKVVGGVYSGRDITVSGAAEIRGAIPGDPNYVPGYSIQAEAKTARFYNPRKGPDNLLNTADDLQGIPTTTSPLKWLGLPQGLAPERGLEEIPNLGAQQYPQKAQAAFGTNGFNGDNSLAEKFVDVKRHLDVNGTDGTWRPYYNSSGNRYDFGTARQITDPNNPAHIFRRNPSDRASINNSTPGVDDYFLEDPTSGATPGQWREIGTSNSNVYDGFDGTAANNFMGTNAYHVKLSNNGDPRRDGNHKVYYIDGNLHVNSTQAFSFVMKNPDGSPVRVSFVVRGNIYFGDNVFYDKPQQDGMSFIALKRSAMDINGDGDVNDAGEAAVANSGNISLGDPLAGTMERIDGFLYADEDFYDNNLTTSGSAQFAIYGNMTAGDNVLINRGGNTTTRSRMDVFFDGRLRYDAAFRNSMPAVPTPDLGDGKLPFQVLYKKNEVYRGASVE